MLVEANLKLSPSYFLGCFAAEVAGLQRRNSELLQWLPNLPFQQEWHDRPEVLVQPKPSRGPMPTVSLTPQRKPMTHWAVYQLPQVSLPAPFRVRRRIADRAVPVAFQHGSASDFQDSGQSSSGVDFRRGATTVRRLE
jgi:hypothetical protein